VSAPHERQVCSILNRPASKSISLEGESFACDSSISGHVSCMVFKRASHMGFDSWVNFRMSSYRGAQSTDSAYIRVANLLQLECLTIAACVTPTDPVLANVSHLLLLNLTKCPYTDG
jgi:hypothetical protein